MTIRAWRKLSIALFLASLCGSCAVPRYDVPYVEGTPSATSIVRRLEYELLDLVRDDTGNQKWLLTEDYQVAVTLSLEVNDTGGLAPSASYLNPLSKVASFAFGGSGTLSKLRDHNFTENLQFSFREIYKDWKRIPTAYPPPVADTNAPETWESRISSQWRRPAPVSPKIGSRRTPCSAAASSSWSPKA